jgi:hypothetical protein
VPHCFIKCTLVVIHSRHVTCSCRIFTIICTWEGGAKCTQSYSWSKCLSANFSYTRRLWLRHINGDPFLLAAWLEQKFVVGNWRENWWHLHAWKNSNRCRTTAATNISEAYASIRDLLCRTLIASWESPSYTNIHINTHLVNTTNSTWNCCRGKKNQWKFYFQNFSKKTSVVAFNSHKLLTTASALHQHYFPHRNVSK